MMFSAATPTVAEMLDTIKTETADKLMSSVLYQTSPLGSTGLPGLDVHLLSASNDRPSPASSLNRGDVLEIQGPAASGKTRLVYNLIIRCILPRVIGWSVECVSYEIETGGWEKAAIVFDTDGKWDSGQLAPFLRSRIGTILSAQGARNQLDIETILTQCLRRLHIFRPRSSASLVATLFRLPSYHSEQLPTEEIALLAIDSISSFYWEDRYHSEREKRLSVPQREESSLLYRTLLALQEFRISHGPVTVLTNWGLFPPSTSTPTSDDSMHATSPYYRQHLRPFPAPFELPARALPNAQLLPPISYHITLVPPAEPKIQNLQEAIKLTRRRAVRGPRAEIRGILRTLKTGNIANFTVDCK